MILQMGPIRSRRAGGELKLTSLALDVSTNCRPLRRITNSAGVVRPDCYPLWSELCDCQ